ncbi:MAG TPA: glycosyltransferase, partial [Pyrinomonadaceae bacterium]|nr:glycosyltransferase [Pyrinomonadaceae bacterium]
RIVLTEYLEDEDLRELYCSCKIFVYPSLYEGFGLPPLEAMACGAAVIASRIPTLVETMGDAAILVEPKNIAELAEAILGLLSDTEAAQELAKTGLERASQFSWYLAALKTMAVYEHVLGRNQ